MTRKRPVPPVEFSYLAVRSSSAAAPTVSRILRLTRVVPGQRGGTAPGTSNAGGSAAGSGNAPTTGGSRRAVDPAGTCPGSCSNAAAGCLSRPNGDDITSVEPRLHAELRRRTRRIVVPLAIAAKPGGGSRLAWVTGYSHYGSSTSSQVHVAELDCNDQLVGTPFTIQGHDFQDLAADDNGGVVVLTRDATDGGTLNCGDVNNLCVVPDSRPATTCTWCGSTAPGTSNGRPS